jgi:glyoxylate reductase
VKPNIFITRKLPDSIIDKLKRDCDVKMWDREEEPVPREILARELAEVDGLLCMLTETIDSELLDQAENLKVISNMAVGYNNIDVTAATDKGIAITNTPGVLTETTADLTFALLMASARRVVEADSFLREGKWKTWSPMLLTGQDIHGSTLGIIGLGRIGEALARRAKGFNMNIIYHSRSPKPEIESELGLEYVEMEELLEISDFVCVLTPYTPETMDLIGQEQLSLMKSNAILINTSRGGVVNEAALYTALEENKIWGAGLDVFEEEPLSLDHPLLRLPNVVTTPHIGSASINTRLKMADLAADNLVKVLREEKNQNIVNPSYSQF